ncbi:hypothetical protein [Xenorhabdus hominickii]|nr:hypothetical protein [Xenorhabdus hominickii]
MEKYHLIKRLEFYYLTSALSGFYAYSMKLNVIFVDDSGDNTDDGGNGNHCDNGLYNKADVNSNYSDGILSLKIKSITII